MFFFLSQLTFERNFYVKLIKNKMKGCVCSAEHRGTSAFKKTITPRSKTKKDQKISQTKNKKLKTNVEQK